MKKIRIIFFVSFVSFFVLIELEKNLDNNEIKYETKKIKNELEVEKNINRIKDYFNQ